MWRARGASTSTTVDVCSPRPIRRHRRCSSPPRPPACAGSPRAQAVAVPAVLAVRDEPPNLLVLEWIDEGRRSPSDEAQFGRQLAELHRAGSPVFGREDRRDDWQSRVAQRAVASVGRVLRRRSACCRWPASPTACCRRRRSPAWNCSPAELDEFAAADEPPARLHGDLWAGNRVVDAQGASWLIDPAAHGGHREFDLAMMRLFGGFGDAVFRGLRRRTSARRTGGPSGSPSIRSPRSSSTP